MNIPEKIFKDISKTKLLEEYQRCLTGMNQVLSWDIANKFKSSSQSTIKYYKD